MCLLKETHLSGEMTAQGRDHEAGLFGGHLGGWLQQFALVNMHETCGPFGTS